MKQNKQLFNRQNKDGKIIKIRIDEITTIPELEKAFNMDSAVKDRIKEDMSINGYSKAKPIHIFWWDEKWVLCDGHTRYTAAKELGLDKIYAQVHTFKSINEALLFSMKEQFNRRNIEDSELFRQYELLRQEEINGHKLTATEMSEKLKKSKRHIFKLQEVFAKSSKEQLKKIREGEASINQIYTEIKKEENLEAEKLEEEAIKAEKAEAEIAAANLAEEVDETEIEQKVQNRIQKEFQQKQRDLQDKELELKKKEALISTKLSDKQILMIGVKCALILKAQGKSDTEILSGDFFPDTIKASKISFTEKELALPQAN